MQLRILQIVFIIVLFADRAAAVPGPDPLKLDCVIMPEEVVKIGSASNGILEEVLVEPGDSVTEGQVLGRLQSDVEHATVELARLRAENGVKIASGRHRAEYFASVMGRTKNLYERKVSTLERMQKAEVEAALAKYELRTAVLEKKIAQVELKRAEALLRQKTIRSPMNAVVTETHLAPGAFVHEQAALLTLAVIDPLTVEVFVPVARYKAIRKGQAARVFPDEPIGGELKAKVKTIDPVFDAASGTFRVRLILPNEHLSVPGGARCQVAFPLTATETGRN
jgi:RND family efflux transporter MFP subunit